MRRAVVFAALATLLPVAACGGGRSNDASTSAVGPQQHHAKPAGFERCPRRALAALPLTVDAERFADAAARRRVGSSPQITVTVRPATHAGARGHEVRFLCGPKIARRAVVVFTWDHRFDSGPNASASLAQHAVMVSRFADGYRVWYVEH